MGAFPLRSVTRHGCPLTPLLFNIILGILAEANKKEKATKGIQIGKQEVKLPIFAANMIMLRRPKILHQELIREFSKIIGYEINTKKPITLIYVNNPMTGKTL